MKFDSAWMNEWLTDLDKRGELHPIYRLKLDNNKPILLGTGSTASVYEMYDRDDTVRSFAVKIIRTNRSNVEGSIEIAKNQQKLGNKSEHIIKIFDIWSIDYEDGPEDKREDGSEISFIFVLMEKLDSILGKSGSEVIIADETLDCGTKSKCDNILSFALQIGDAIKTAHDEGIIHRDIKLENIFKDPANGAYKLGDFGAAKYTPELYAETVVFTNGYGAPEIEMQLSSGYNSTVDIYSWGITLYLLLNKLSFPGSSDYRASIAQHSEQFVFPAPVYDAGGLIGIIRRMCSYRPEDRYQSADEVIEEINSLVKREKEKHQEEIQFTENSKGGETGSDLFETEVITETDEEDVHTNSRFERHISREASDRRYRRFNIISTFVLGVMFAALFTTLNSEPGEHFFSIPMWIVPAMLVLVTVSRLAGELRWAATLAALTVCVVMSVFNPGINMPFIFILVLLGGNSVCCLGASAGAWIWLILGATGLIGRLTLLTDYYFNWLFEIIIVSAYLYLTRQEAMHGRIGKKKTVIIYGVCGLAMVLMFFYSASASFSVGGQGLALIEETAILFFLISQILMFIFGRVPAGWVSDLINKRLKKLQEADRMLRNAGCNNDVVLKDNDELISRAYEELKILKTAGEAKEPVDCKSEAAVLAKELDRALKESKKAVRTGGSDIK